MAEHCNATKTDGTPCRSYAAQGGTTCVLHSPKGVEIRALATRRSAETRRAKVEQREEALDRAKMGVRERLALRLNERADDVVTVMVDDAIEKRDAVTLRTALDQGLGKPVERVEQVQGDDIASMSREERLALIHSLQLRRVA